MENRSYRKSAAYIYADSTNAFGKGFGEGTFTPGINLKRIETAIMVDNVDVAFISIYLKGTTAVVQVNERKLTSEKENLNLPINLVADYPGQIVNLEVVSGQSVVKRGEAVEKGQLLVSGIIDSNTVGYRIKSASGKVMASTSHDIYYEIPLVQPKKYYTGNENRQKSVKILGKYINFFANSGNLYEKYDTIYNESSITLFDVIQLPVYFVERVYSEYIEKDVEIDVKRARELAYDNYAEFAAGRKSLTIEKENLEEKIENGKFILYGTVECIEDISQEKPFYYIQE
ncbi:MAG: sporulation protein YqfD [Clostridia bacterium]|nr:sporulation protein YqfD [Clostridia bacterium]